MRAVKGKVAGFLHQIVFPGGAGVLLLCCIKPFVLSLESASVGDEDCSSQIQAKSGFSTNLNKE